jgi:hypothetical protein
VVRRYDADITILPIKYLEEMRLIPRHKLNSKIPQVKVSVKLDLECTFLVVGADSGR